MPSCSALDDPAVPVPIKPVQRSIGNGIGEIPFFLEVPANPERSNDDWEQKIAELEHDKS